MQGICKNPAERTVSMRAPVAANPADPAPGVLNFKATPCQVSDFPLFFLSKQRPITTAETAEQRKIRNILARTASSSAPLAGRTLFVLPNADVKPLPIPGLHGSMRPGAAQPAVGAAPKAGLVAMTGATRS